MDEGTGTTVKDLVAGHNGTISNASWVDTVNGPAIDFNGSNSLITINNFADLDNMSGVSIMASVMWDTCGESNGSRIVDLGDSDTNVKGWRFCQGESTTAMRLGFYVEYDVTNVRTLKTNVPSYFNTWNIAGVRWNGNLNVPNSAPFFYNGTTQAGGSYTVGANNRVDDSGLALYIGGNGTGAHTWDGHIKNLMIWKRQINFREALQVYYNPYLFIQDFDSSRYFYTPTSPVTPGFGGRSVTVIES
jgi:hypothetical protein